MQIQKYLNRSFKIEDFQNPKESRITPEIWEIVKPFVFQRLNTVEKVENELARIKELTPLGLLYRVKLSYQKELELLYKYICAEEAKKVLADINAIAQYDLIFSALPSTQVQTALLIAAGYLEPPKPKEAKPEEPREFGKAVEAHLNAVMARYQQLQAEEEF